MLSFVKHIDLKEGCATTLLLFENIYFDDLTLFASIYFLLSENISVQLSIEFIVIQSHLYDLFEFYSFVTLFFFKKVFARHCSRLTLEQDILICQT